MAKETTKKKETVSKTESLVKREYSEEEKASIAKYQELAKRKPVKFKEVKGDSGKLNIDFESNPDGDGGIYIMAAPVGVIYLRQCNAPYSSAFSAQARCIQLKHVVIKKRKMSKARKFTKNALLIILSLSGK